MIKTKLFACKTVQSKKMFHVKRFAQLWKEWRACVGNGADADVFGVLRINPCVRNFMGVIGFDREKSSFGCCARIVTGNVLPGGIWVERGLKFTW